MATDSVTGGQLLRASQTLIATDSPPPQATSSSSSATDKSKLKIGHEKEEDEPTCGICLSEGGEGVISRGWIDSCDHYFCFVCIMEWSKLESKCPLCKRRFFSIRRPPKPGVFLSERVVNVPIRDQVYHCFGNASVGPPNLYSDVRCAVCHSGTDENLLLLCDLCDSASHTYCVGLGATVPEGDWFCADCTLLRAEHTMSDIQAEADDQSGLHNFVKRSSNEKDVSISNIVQDTCTFVVERSSTNSLTSFVPTEERIGTRDYRNELVSRRQSTTSLPASKLNTRTLLRCHNIYNRIQAFRENWNNYRSGSLSFSSTKVEHGAAAAQKPEIDGTSAQQDSLSCLSQPMDGQNDTSDMSHDRGSHDISKAWKMMDIAKSIEGRKRTKHLHLTSNHPVKKINVSKEAGKMSLQIPSSLNERLGYQDLQCSGPRKHQHNQFSVRENVRRKSEMLGKQNQSWDAVNDIPNGDKGLVITCSSADSENSYLQEVHLPLQHESSNRVGRKLPEDGDPFNIQNKVGGSACFNSSSAKASVDLNMPCTKPLAHTSPSSSGKNSLHRGLSVKHHAVGKSAGDNDAKSEIQSLVKLNLKILTRDKKLEIGEFKQIARLATHSILAACGLEHPKPGDRPYPSSICCHADEIGDLRRSSLMPSSCRECFYVFVKDVVSAIMLEKIGYTETN